ncbi:MAG: hypothetical protein WHU10_07320 [Fimbriimonadales bacterium]
MIDRLDIHAWVDGELDPEQQKLVSQAVEADRELTAEFHAIALTKATVKSKCEQVQSPEAWAKCRDRLREFDSDLRVQRFVGRYAWGICGVFLAILLVGAWINRTLGNGLIRPGEVASMASTLVPVAQPRTTEPTKMHQWAVGTIGDAPMNLNPGVCRVRSIATGFAGGRRIIRVDLRDARGDVSVLAVSGASTIEGLRPLPSGGEFLCGSMNGLPCLAWTDNGYALFVVGNRDFESLRGIALATKVR